MADAETRLFLAELRAGRPSALRRLRSALRTSGGNVGAAATALGVHYGRLYEARAASPAVRAVFDEQALGRTGAAGKATTARLSSKKN